jgi:hypothetical protein
MSSAPIRCWRGPFEARKEGEKRIRRTAWGGGLNDKWWKIVWVTSPKVRVWPQTRNQTRGLNRHHQRCPGVGVLNLDPTGTSEMYKELFSQTAKQDEAYKLEMAPQKSSHLHHHT